MQLVATGRHRMPSFWPQVAPGRHRAPQDAKFWPQNPANLPKSGLPPAQECQMAQLGTLPEPVEPKCSHKLARTIPSETTGDPVPNLPPGEHKDKHPSIQASKPRVPEVGGRGGSLFNPPHLVKR